MAGERKLTVTWDGKDVGLKRAADKAAGDVADSAKDMSSSFDDAGDESGDSFLSGIGGKIAAGIAAVGIAGAAVLAKGFSDALDLEVVTDKLSAQLGGGEFGADMGKIAGNLYADAFGESVADTGEAVRQVWQNGLINEDATNAEIEALTAKVLTFTDVMDKDLDMTTQAVSNMVRSGIADSSEQALDIMTRGIQQGADRAGDLGETFQEYSTIFRDIGISAADATGLMSQGLKAGARDADTVADALKEMAIRGQDGSTSSAEGFKAIGLSAEEMTAKFAAGGSAAREGLGQVLDGLRNMEDPVARNAAAVGLFGTKAEDLGDALFALDLDTAADGLGEVAGATDELGSAYDNASTKIETFKRGALMALAEFVGGTLIPALESFASWMTDTFGPTFDTVKDAVTSLISAFQGNGELDDGGVLATMAEAGADLRDAWDTLVDTYNTELKPALDDLIAKGREIIEDIDWATVWQELQPILAAAGAAFMAFAVFAITAIGQIITNITSFITKIQELWREHESFRIIVTAAWNLVSTKVQTSLAIITGTMQLATAILRGDWSAAWDAIVKIASNAWNSMTSTFRTISNTIRAIGGSMWNPISAGLSSVVSSVEGQINRLIRAYNSIPFVPDVSTIGGGSSGPVRKLASTIPKFAAGGVVTKPTLGWIAEAGQPEAVVPLDRLDSMIRGGGGAARLEIGSDGSEVGDFLVQLLRKSVRNRGGIDVVFS